MHTSENSRRTAWCAVAGGALWALTPLRDQIFGAGADPKDGVLIFRLYNLLVVLAVLALAVALVTWLRRRACRPGRALVIAATVVQVGHTMLIVGSLAAVVLGDRARDLVTAGQDLGFLGSMVAALAALPLGALALRRAALPRASGWCFVATLPVGIVGLLVLGGLGFPEDLLGLPLTVLYGGAFVMLGRHWLSVRPVRQPALA